MTWHLIAALLAGSAGFTIMFLGVLSFGNQEHPRQ